MTTQPIPQVLTKTQASELFVLYCGQARWRAAKEILDANELDRWVIAAGKNKDDLNRYWEEMPEELKTAIRSEWESASASL